jgi:flagellar basal body-associated protein FliL
MSKRMLIALVVIVLIVILGMVTTMKRSLNAAASHDPDATVTKPAPAKAP